MAAKTQVKDGKPWFYIKLCIQFGKFKKCYNYYCEFFASFLVGYYSINIKIFGLTENYVVLPSQYCVEYLL